MGMKNINIILLALLFVACEKIPVEYSPVQKETDIVISGGFDRTKTAITDMSGATAKVVWTLGDRIGILSKSNPNAMAVLAEPSAGMESGIFLPEDAIPTGSQEPVSFTYPDTGNEDFIIYYPYNASAKADMDHSRITSSLEESQYQDRLQYKINYFQIFYYQQLNHNNQLHYNLLHRNATHMLMTHNRKPHHQFAQQSLELLFHL